MAYNKSKVSKKIRLNLNGLPDDIAEQVKKDVGEFVVDEILKSVGKGKTPVAGAREFAKLNPDYAKNQKGGNRTPNLELMGEMLDELIAKPTSNGIEVGIEGKQAIKAYAHNTGFKGHKKLQSKKLQRQFIPRSNEKFKDKIENGIKEIVSKAKQEHQQSEGTRDSDPDLFVDGKINPDLTDGSGMITIDDVLSGAIERDALGGLFGDLI